MHNLSTKKTCLFNEAWKHHELNEMIDNNVQKKKKQIMKRWKE